MSDLRFSFPASVIAAKGEITRDDVILLRCHLWPEGITSRLQASMAIALDACCSAQCSEWRVFLVEAITAFVVGCDSQDGEVTGSTAGWLLEWLAERGVLRSEAALDIVLHVLETAHEAPHFLSALALNQLRLALLPEPIGPYAAERDAAGAKGGAVAAADIAFIWRVLRRSVERGCMHLSRAEQLVLAAIDGLARLEEHHPDWRDILAVAQVTWPVGCIGGINRRSDAQGPEEMSASLVGTTDRWMFRHPAA